MMNAFVASSVFAATVSGMAVSEWDTQPRMPGQYMVALNEMVTAQRQVDMFSMVSDMGGRVFEVYDQGFQGFAVAGLTDDLAAKLAQEPMVKYVEPDFIQEISQATCSDDSSTNWGLGRITGGRQSGTPGSTQFPNRFDSSACGEGVELFILDTGVRRNHDDFANNDRDEIFFGDYTGSNQQDDDQGHGSHVASTAGGLLYGVAKCAQTRSLKVCNLFGQCPNTATAAALNAVVGVLREDPSRKIVVNMSLGGGFSQASNDQANAAARAGAIVVAAAGNSNADSCRFSPASGELVYSVMASNINDSKSSFSNFGSCSNVWAPGEAITAALHTGASNAVRTISGTSMACPHVAGVMANYWSANPSLGPREIEALVTADAVPNVINNGNQAGSPNLLVQNVCGSRK